MTKKDYIRAAKIVFAHKSTMAQSNDASVKAAQDMIYTAQVEAFVAFFRGDNPQFDAQRFRDACRLGV